MTILNYEPEIIGIRAMNNYKGTGIMNNMVMSRFSKSMQHLLRAERTIPLGSQTFSKSRTQYPVGISPLYTTKAKGAEIWDLDGNKYIDLVSALASVTLGYGDKKVKVITTIAMFYDLPDPTKFINDVYKVLDDNGIWVLQLSYTPLMIKQLAFDNICHEHAYYYSLTSFQKLFSKFGLKIVDCSLNDVNGGSFRVYVQKDIADITSFATSPLRDVCNFRIQSLLEYEKNSYDIGDPKLWESFMKNIESLKKQTVDFIKQEKAKGKMICGYGASTKGNTLLQWFGLDNTMIDAIAERSPYKFGLKTVGTNIPVLSEEEVRKMKPDYMLVLPWHFISAFINRESEFLKNGGKFIVPCPKFEIISK